MRLLVCGSRHLTGFKLVSDHILKHCPDYTVMIHGGARGADSLAGMVAYQAGKEVEIFRANWQAHGRAAGLIRNQRMLDEGKPDMVIAFLAPDSRGTRDMIARAERANIPTAIVEVG